MAYPREELERILGQAILKEIDALNLEFVWKKEIK